MKIIAIVLSAIIIVILGFVLIDNLSSVDFVRTKNMVLQREYLSNVQQINSVDSLYREIEKQVNYRRVDFDKQSDKSLKDIKLIGLVIFLVILNLILIIRIKNAT